MGTRCYSGITQFDPLNLASELVLTINPRQGLTCGDVAELSLVGGDSLTNIIPHKFTFYSFSTSQRALERASEGQLLNLF